MFCSHQHFFILLVLSTGYLVKLNFLLEKYELEYEQVNLAEFEANGLFIAGSSVTASHDIVLLKIRRKIKDTSTSDVANVDCKPENIKPLVPY
jgi:hypothetical protein